MHLKFLKNQKLIRTFNILRHPMSEKGFEVRKIETAGDEKMPSSTPSGRTEELKCPICGTANPPDAEQCGLCMTKLAVDDEGRGIKVVGPTDGGDIFSMIDLEDPLTRKQLEELLLIPGVTKRKALYLYRSGITSLEEFVEKAFHGDRHGKNFARIVANKLIMDDLKRDRPRGEGEEKSATCSQCNTVVKARDGKCHVCGSQLETDIPDVDMSLVSDRLGEVAESIIGELSEVDDFAALPDEMKAQVASILDSDEQEPVDISTVIEGLGKEFKDLGIVDDPKEEGMAGEKPAASDSVTGKPGGDSGGGEEAPAEGKPDRAPAEDRKRKILLEKIKQWYMRGYDVSGLYELIDGDIETFKSAAQEMLRKGKRSQ